MAQTPSEKTDSFGHIESVRQATDLADLENCDAHKGQNHSLPIYGDRETIRVLRKVDLRLLPMLTLLYVISYLDRGNIGNARVAGMNDDLGLTDTEYRLALTVRLLPLPAPVPWLTVLSPSMFFIPYALFEVPSNMILKLMKPSRWIAFLVVVWGIVRLLAVL
ncbi:hypothetical protein ACJ41O_012397 [Fusarium nematophilum]